MKKMLLVLILCANMISATCVVQGYFHNETGDAVNANSSIYCQGLEITKQSIILPGYSVSFGGILDNCDVCAPLIKTTATNLAGPTSLYYFNFYGSASRTSNFSVRTIELNVTLNSEKVSKRTNEKVNNVKKVKYTISIPVQKEGELEKIQELESKLECLGITFDTGYDFKNKVRDWELDTLKGASTQKMLNLLKNSKIKYAATATK